MTVDLSGLLPRRRPDPLPDDPGHRVDQGEPVSDRVTNNEAVGLANKQDAMNKERMLRLETRKEPLGSFCKKRPDGRKKAGRGSKAWSPWCK